MESGAQWRFLLRLCIGLTHKEIVDIIHVGSIFIFLPQFSTNGLIDVIFLKIDHSGVSFGMLVSSIHHNSWHLLVKEGLWCLGHDHSLTAINVRPSQILFQFLHRTIEIVQGSWSKIKYIAFYITTPTLEVGISFNFLTLVLSPCIIFPMIFWLVRPSLVFLRRALWLNPFRGSIWFIFYHPLRLLILSCWVHKLRDAICL